MSERRPVNPFPRLAVASPGPAKLPDYRPAYYFDAQRLIDLWLEDLLEVAAAAGAVSKARSPVGLSAGVRGKFGSGKTHLLMQLMRYVEARGLETAGAG